MASELPPSYIHFFHRTSYFLSLSSNLVSTCCSNRPSPSHPLQGKATKCCSSAAFCLSYGQTPLVMSALRCVRWQ